MYMHNAQQGKDNLFDASKYRIGIVVAEFNKDITEQLLASALQEAERFHIPAKNIKVFHVPGSVEIPVILRALAKSKKYDGLVALGAIIRGETDHYAYVANIVSQGILEVMMSMGVPVGFGVLTCENMAQATARIGSGKGALVAALQSAKIIRDLKNAK